MTVPSSKYRFLLISPFSLEPGSSFQMRSYSGSKETMIHNYQDVAPSLEGVDWEVDTGARTTHGNWPVTTKFEFMSVGLNRLPRVREACESGKYNAIVLMGGGDPGYLEAREIGRQYKIPITTAAHAQMHLAGMLGNKFSIIDIAETHNMQMYHLVVQYRMTDRCASIRNINFPLPHSNYPDEKPVQRERDQALQSGTTDMLEAAISESIAAIEEDGADVLILGCSATFWMQPFLQKRLHEAGWDVPVLEGARAAIEVAKMLVDLGVDASGLAFPSVRPAKWRRKKTF